MAKRERRLFRRNSDAKTIKTGYLEQKNKKKTHFIKKNRKKFAGSKKSPTFALALRHEQSRNIEILVR